jgi:hypothetical protein
MSSMREIKANMLTMKDARKTATFMGSNFPSFFKAFDGTGPLIFHRKTEKYKNTAPPKRDRGIIQMPTNVVGGWPAQEARRFPKQTMLRAEDNRASKIQISFLIKSISSILRA